MARVSKRSGADLVAITGPEERRPRLHPGIRSPAWSPWRTTSRRRTRCWGRAGRAGPA